jgi:hypothetical protein
MKWSKVKINGCEISDFLLIVKFLTDWRELIVNYYAHGLKTFFSIHVIAKRIQRFVNKQIGWIF